MNKYDRTLCQSIFFAMMSALLFALPSFLSVGRECAFGPCPSPTLTPLASFINVCTYAFSFQYAIFAFLKFRKLQDECSEETLDEMDKKP